ncbi:CD276 antigen homolog isoform X3 [Xiphophorus couchianus]|uniref:CD276 antigen homolog isoform X3 n=1 Tax=Xiphophorus couchianus TaxID=32473 RepID=UPI00101604FC|nr:CD276 antigen homolog isoform X3 [Xiphophorus couchianus]
MKLHIKRIQICIFILLHSVICLDVKGFVGKSVLLPCSYNSSKKVNVFWRDRHNNVLLDIKDGSEDLTYQDQSYKGRVSSFPTEYQNKNYSITLKNLKENDTGTYECNINFDGEEITNHIKLEERLEQPFRTQTVDMLMLDQQK